MRSVVKLKGGLDIDLVGKARQQLMSVSQTSTVYALCPDDFVGIKPRLLVKVGDEVKAGEALFENKKYPNVKFVSPVSGTVTDIVRGDRRKVLSVQVRSQEPMAGLQPSTLSPQPSSPQEIMALLAERGLLGYITQMPYAVSADDERLPDAVFVSLFRDMPLSADVDFCLQGREDDFRKGIEVLAKVAPVFIGIRDGEENASLLDDIPATITAFRGKCPVGNVNVQINHVRPINKGDRIWTLEPEVVVFIGELFRHGQVSFRKRIAVCGSQVAEPCYADVVIGQQVAPLLTAVDSGDNVRLINGNVLTGRRISSDGFVGAHAYELTAIPECSDDAELLGWIMPLCMRRKKSPDARIKGGKRHMIMSGEYDKVLPMDIYAEYLIKAITTQDIDRMEQLGIYEVAPEDFALAEYVDSSKLELQRIVREGLEMLRKENE
ncbi:MAG: Na(+)-translocating NADH-quinone reductase subunit A [Prevotella sp.]|nr:Na(+)-translocating NADH-quinone reductase subunit A [Candidatus Equicola faecalis]